MKRFAFVLLAGACLLPGQTPPRTGSLEFRLQAGNVAAGVPLEFTFQLVNQTDHDVRLPSPSIECQNSVIGDIRLDVSFKPAEGDVRNLRKGGCASDSGSRPPIATLVEKWQTLHPAESLTLVITPAEHSLLRYRDDLAGTYEYQATYTPPYLTPEDQKSLREMAIDFPNRPLISNVLTFVRTQPGGLELRLQGENIVAGIPQDFIFQLVNHTDGNVRLPEPQTECPDSMHGELRLHLEFTPAQPGSRELRAHSGCAADVFGRAPIALSIQGWTTLRPGEALTVKAAGHSMLLYDDLLAGKYVISAGYDPPYLTSDEKKRLGEMGVNFPDRQLASNYLTFVKGK